MNRQPVAVPEAALALSTRRTWRYAAIGFIGGFAFPLLASIIKVLSLSLPLTPLNMLAAQQLDPVIWVTDTAPFFLGLVAALAGRQQDRVVQANAVLRQRELELSSIRTNLENNVLERTRELDERNAQMRSVITFARQLAEIQDMSTLLRTAVDSIHEHFAPYDMNLYLIDERGQAAFLRSSSSEEGNALAENGFRIPLADQGLIGRVARRGKMLTSSVRPEAQAGKPSAAPTLTEQITLPLTVQARVVGVLDLLPSPPRQVGQNELDVLQLMVDQLAVAIQSAQQSAEARATVQQLENLTGEATRAAWYQYLKNNSIAYQFTPAGVRSLSAGEAAASADPGVPRVPLLLRGQRIGSLSLRTRSGALAATEQDLLKKVAVQIAMALENVRLLEETRQRAAQEQIISEISSRFTRSLDVDALLQVAVREFAALPDVAEATVLLKPTDEPGLQTPN